MYDNAVLKEVREAREAYAGSFDFDIAAMVADLERQNEQGDWPVVRLAPRRPAGYKAKSAASEPEIWSGPIESPEEVR